ncbi:MAG: hypothetical protein WB441_11575 [Nocardioidaceae bacterium]
MLPGELADDLESVASVVETGRTVGTLTQGGPMARFLDALATTGPGLLAEPAGGTDAAAYVMTDPADPMGNLRVVADLARAEGLCVLDVAALALYDPRGAVEVSLETEAGPRLTYLTRPVLADVVTDIEQGRYHWLSLHRRPQVFAQTYRDPDGSWAVEHRAGGPDQHHAARVEDADLVERLLWSWARDDGRWAAMVSFSPVRL